MDAFEQIVAEIFWKEGYWVQSSFKVELNSDVKKSLGNPSMPRPEIDVLAYSGARNEALLIECKSFLDSRGVIAAHVLGERDSSKYKMFRNQSLRDLVFRKLQFQLIKSGACPDNVKLSLCLACGKIATQKDRERLSDYFKSNNWNLFDDNWIRQKVRAMSEVGYENQVSTVIAKLLKN